MKRISKTRMMPKVGRMIMPAFLMILALKSLATAAEGDSTYHAIEYWYGRILPGIGISDHHSWNKDIGDGTNTLNLFSSLQGKYAFSYKRVSRLADGSGIQNDSLLEKQTTNDQSNNAYQLIIQPSPEWRAEFAMLQSQDHNRMTSTSGRLPVDLIEINRYYHNLSSYDSRTSRYSGFLSYISKNGSISYKPRLYSQDYYLNWYNRSALAATANSFMVWPDRAQWIVHASVQTQKTDSYRLHADTYNGQSVIQGTYVFSESQSNSNRVDQEKRRYTTSAVKMQYGWSDQLCFGLAYQGGTGTSRNDRNEKDFGNRYVISDDFNRMSSYMYHEYRVNDYIEDEDESSHRFSSFLTKSTPHGGRNLGLYFSTFSDGTKSNSLGVCRI